jgi:hypothetical protein
LAVDEEGKRVDEAGRTYDRPIIEPDNMMTGGFQTGSYDAAPRTSTGRMAAWASLAFAVVWVGGLGSMVAIAAAGLALASGDIGVGPRRAALAGLVLGIVGLVAGVVLVVGL